MEEQQKDLEQIKADFLNYLRKKYPIGVPRCRAAEASGGLVSAKTLANISSNGNLDKPKDEYRVRNRIIYSHESFCNWMFGE